MSGQIFSSMKYVVTWVGCDKECTLSLRTFEDFHDARCFASRRIDRSGITIEKVYTVIEVENISKRTWYLPEVKG
jgi:hypothetical protein